MRVVISRGIAVMLGVFLASCGGGGYNGGGSSVAPTPTPTPTHRLPRLQHPLPTPTPAPDAERVFVDESRLRRIGDAQKNRPEPQESLGHRVRAERAGVAGEQWHADLDSL